MWAAPEQLTGEPCTLGTDIWAFGVVLWELATGEQPVNRLLRAISVPGEAPQTIVDLIDRCHTVDQNERPSAIEAHDVIASSSSSGI